MGFGRVDQRSQPSRRLNQIRLDRAAVTITQMENLMEKITHIDTSNSALTPHNLTGNWLNHINENGEWDRSFILYDWGTRQTRAASVEWLDDTRKILRFEHFDRNDPMALHSGRIQIQRPLEGTVTKIEEYRRMRINFTKGPGWCAMAEWWSGSTYDGDAYAARISMGYGPGGLIFYMDKQQIGDPLWESVWVSEPVPVPTQAWFDIYVRVIPGDDQTGAFQVATREPGGTYTRVIDIQNYTYNPDAPHGMCPHFTNPLMFYTGAATIQEVIDSGQPCSIDLRMFEQWIEKI